ncbi:MAG TPA: NUDIX domain-containing protein [Anaerolineales bacterium]|nr:NUDIX domain-containing protein [Anaerolineales bacterium]
MCAGAESSEFVQREYPPCPLVSAHAIVLQQDRVLLVRRADDPGRGRWSVPGGLVRLGETIRQATQRETREECGVEIESDEVIDVRDNIVFACEIITIRHMLGLWLERT